MLNRLSLINWLSNNKNNKLFQAILISVIVSSGVWGIRCLNTKIFDVELWDLKIFDYFFALKPQEKPENRIVIIGVDEGDIREFGYPIPDETLAQLLLKITGNQLEKKTKEAKYKQEELTTKPIIGLDIIRDIPVPPGHKKLIEVFQTTPHLIGVGSTLSKAEQTIEFPPVLLEKNQVGDIAVPVDRDFVIRKGFLWPNLKNNQKIPSLSLKLALIYLSNQGITPRHSEINKKWLKLKETSFPFFQSTDGGYVSDEGGGYQIIINWRKNPEPFKQYSLREVLNQDIDFSNKIVIIAGTAPSVNDTFITPLSLVDQQSPNKMYGVVNIAHLTSQIISSVLDNRPLIKTISDLGELLELWLCTLSVSIILTGFHQNLFQNFIRILLIIGVSSVLLSVSHYFLFLNGYWIPLAPVLLSINLTGVIFLLLSFRQDRELNFIIKKFNSVINNHITNPVFELRQILTQLTLSSQEVTKNLEERQNLLILRENLEKLIKLPRVLFPDLEEISYESCSNFNNWLREILEKDINQMRLDSNYLEIDQIDFRIVDCEQLTQGCVVASQLEFVFSSIFKNAIESVFEKLEEDLEYQPKIIIKTVLINSHKISVTIQNNGLRISSDSFNYIFEPFFTTKNEEQHNGLNLYYCAEIIKKIGGTIKVNSNDRFTEFIVNFPYDEQ